MPSDHRRPCLCLCLFYLFHFDFLFFFSVHGHYNFMDKTFFFYLFHFIYIHVTYCTYLTKTWMTRFCFFFCSRCGAHLRSTTIDIASPMASVSFWFLFHLKFSSVLFFLSFGCFKCDFCANILCKCEFIQILLSCDAWVRKLKMKKKECKVQWNQYRLNDTHISIINR